MDKADSYLSIPLLSNDRTGNDDEDDETVFQNDVLDLSLSSGIDILNESRKLSQNIGERSVREIRNINQARTSDAETGYVSIFHSSAILLFGKKTELLIDHKYTKMWN